MVLFLFFFGAYLPLDGSTDVDASQCAESGAQHAPLAGLAVKMDWHSCATQELKSE